MTRGGGWVCGVADLPRKITVTDGRFDYPFQVDPPSPPSPLPVQVRADGTFVAKEQYFLDTPSFNGRGYILPWVTVKGRIVHGTLEAVEDDYRCARRSVLRRLAARPPRPGSSAGSGPGGSRAAYSVVAPPRMMVAWADSTPPLPCTRAVSAAATWRAPHSPRNWRTASISRNRPYMPGWQ